jgi:hypothetical protein
MSARGPRWGSVRAPVDDCMTAASIKDLLDKVVFVSSCWSPPLGSKDSSEGKEARTEGGIGLVLIELQTASDVIESQRRAVMPPSPRSARPPASDGRAVR